MQNNERVPMSLALAADPLRLILRVGDRAFSVPLPAAGAQALAYALLSHTGPEILPAVRDAIHAEMAARAARDSDFLRSVGVAQ